MAKWKINEEDFERQYAEAVARGAEKVRTEPQAESVSYDYNKNHLVIQLKSGATFTIPCHLLREFEGVAPSRIAEIELRPRGAAIHWPQLDQDMSIAGLISSVLGNEMLMAELGRRGGSASSEVKAAAARENGRKGGRPAKTREARHELIEVRLVEPTDLVFADHIRIAQSSQPLTTIQLVNGFDDYISALQEGALVTNAKGYLVTRPEPFAMVGTSLSGQEGVNPMFGLCLKGGKEAANNEAANNNELALAA